VKDENVELKTLAIICKELDCDFSDIVEYIKDEPTSTYNHLQSKKSCKITRRSPMLYEHRVINYIIFAPRC
jgi:hypothetical protein